MVNKSLLGRWGRALMLMGLCLLLVLPATQCSPHPTWQSADNRCDPRSQGIEEHPDWKLIAPKLEEGVDACLQIAWGADVPNEAKTTPVKLKRDGRIYAYDDATGAWTKSPLLSFTRGGKDTRWRFRLLIFHPATRGDRRGSLCLVDMKDVAYDCLAGRVQDECLATYEFQPNIDAFKGKYFPISGSSGARCSFSLKSHQVIEPSTDAQEPDAEPPLPDASVEPSQELPRETIPEQRSEQVIEGACRDGETKTCYSGSVNSLNVGICKAGKQTCSSGVWGPCLGEILPVSRELCFDGVDNNCDGSTDEDCPTATPWLATGGSLSQLDGASEIALNSVGQPHVVGYLGDGNVKIGPLQTTAKHRDGFIMRKSREGKLITFVRLLPAQGKSAGDEAILAMRFLPKTDELLIAGHFGGEVFFPSRIGPSRSSIEPDGKAPPGKNLPTDAFVAKFDKHLNALWVSSIGGRGFDTSTDVAFDSKGYIYVTGIVKVDWSDPKQRTIKCTGNNSQSSFLIPTKQTASHFIAKLEPGNGVFQWCRSFGGRPTTQASLQQNEPFAYGPHLAADAKGGLYISDAYRKGTIFFDQLFLSSFSANIFVAKFDEKGQWLWVKSSESKGDGANALSVTDFRMGPKGGLYLSGSFEGAIPFDQPQRSLSSQGKKDVFIAKMNDKGDWVWTMRAGGAGNDEAFGLAIDLQQRVYATGYVTTKANFGVHTTTPPANPMQQAFIARIDQAQTWEWVITGGNGASDTGQAIAVAANGAVLVSGVISTTSFGPFTGLPVANPDLFFGWNIHKRFGK